MNPTNKLAIKTVIIAAIIMVLLYGAYLGLRNLVENYRKNSQPQTNNKAITNEAVEKDTDQDGLPDAVENIFKTNPNQADSDSDGTTDGDEVAQKRDPSLAGPDDDLVKAVSTNIPPEDTYTYKYLQQIPNANSPADLFDQQKIEQFITQVRGDLLPKLPAGAVKTNSEAGKDAVQKYLESISSQHNSEIKAVSSSDIEQAFRQNYLNQQPGLINDVVATLEKNYSTLEAITTPQETAALHEKLLSASQALINNAHLLQNSNNDLVGALLGAKNIQDLGPIFTEISDQIKSLESKYGLQ